MLMKKFFTQATMLLLLATSVQAQTNDYPFELSEEGRVPVLYSIFSGRDGNGGKSDYVFTNVIPWGTKKPALCLNRQDPRNPLNQYWYFMEAEDGNIMIISAEDNKVVTVPNTTDAPKCTEMQHKDSITNEYYTWILDNTDNCYSFKTSDGKSYLSHNGGWGTASQVMGLYNANGSMDEGSRVFIEPAPEGVTVSTVATCKEVNDAADGKFFVVTGTVTKIINTTYGNWYMTDGTAELYIYGTLDAEGKPKNFESLGLAVGDKVTVEGPKGSYKGDPQMVDVTVNKIEKALIKILSESVGVGNEGGKLEVAIATKEKEINVAISEKCKEWVTYETVQTIPGVATESSPTPADTLLYTFNIAANNAGAREGSISFSVGNEYPIPYTFTQAGGIADVTVAEFLAAEVNDAAQYRIVGHVIKIDTKYNNNFYVKDYTGEVYAYYVDTQGHTLAIGDFVTLVGKRGEYRGTPQMPKGTLLEKYTASPEVSVADFLAKEDSKEVYYKLTGTIDEIKNAQYGNINLKDANGDNVYVYGILPGYGATGDAKKGMVDAKGLKVGDTITIVGNRASYKGTPQVGNAVYLSHISVDETDIAVTPAENSAETAIFTLTGQKVGKVSRPGIYVINGKKTVVK